MQYWPIDPDTDEVLAPRVAMIRGGIPHAPKFSLFEVELEPRDGYAIIAQYDEEGTPTGVDYVEDHRGKTIFSQSDCQVVEIVNKLGPIADGWAMEKPASRWDIWTDSGWQTDEQAKFESEVKVINDLRRQQYAQIVDPLMNEARMQRMLGDDAGADKNEQQAQAWYLKIKQDNPWPPAPAVE